MVSLNKDAGSLEDQPLFRVISFYELIDILEKMRLRFARIDTMDDPNEAITAVLDSELAAAYVGNDFNPLETDKRHKAIMRAVYINCWTREPENIAVWSIYSPNKDRVMVRTSTGKLKAALDDLDERSLGLREEIFLKNKDVSSVHYVNLHDLRERWSQKAEVMREALTKDRESGVFDGTGPAEATQLRRLRSDDLRTPYFKKDERYEYEREVRAVFQLKARAEQAIDSPEIEDMGFVSSNERPICEQDNVPEQIKIPISKHFIEEIVIDGRMSSWQREAIKSVLQKFDMRPKVSGSRAFSSLYE